MRYFAIAVVAVVVLIIAWAIIAGVATEALWFASLGYDPVYWKVFWTKALLWVFGAGVAAVWFGLNFRVAAKVKPLVVSRQIIDLERILPRGSKPVWWLAGLATARLLSCLTCLST